MQRTSRRRDANNLLGAAFLPVGHVGLAFYKWQHNLANNCHNCGTGATQAPIVTTIVAARHQKEERKIIEEGRKEKSKICGTIRLGAIGPGCVVSKYLRDNKCIHSWPTLQRPHQTRTHREILGLVFCQLTNCLALAHPIVILLSCVILPALFMGSDLSSRSRLRLGHTHAAA